MTKKTPKAPAQSEAEPAPPLHPRRHRAEIGAELVALEVAYRVTASNDVLQLMRRTADEFLETFR